MEVSHVFTKEIPWFSALISHPPLLMRGSKHFLLIMYKCNSILLYVYTHTTDLRALYMKYNAFFFNFKYYVYYLQNIPYV